MLIYSFNDVRKPHGLLIQEMQLQLKAQPNQVCNPLPLMLVSNFTGSQRTATSIIEGLLIDCSICCFPYVLTASGLCVYPTNEGGSRPAKLYVTCLLKNSRISFSYRSLKVEDPCLRSLAVSIVTSILSTPP